MACRLTITEAANQDMDNIFAYIINQLCNLKAAMDLAEAIETKYHEVCLSPYMFEEARDKVLKNKGYRRIPVNNYVILYKLILRRKRLLLQEYSIAGKATKNAYSKT